MLPELESRRKNDLRDGGPQLLHEERLVENIQENTRDWVQRTFFREPSKIGGLGGKIEAEKDGEKRRPVKLLNWGERNKSKTKEVLNGHHKAASTPPNINDSHCCSGQQNFSTKLPHKSQAPFSKGVIQFGPSGNGKTCTGTRKPSLRKEDDHQKNAFNWASEPGKNSKTKSLWIQRFFRNPHRKPFPWRFKTCGEDEEEGRKEIREEGIDMREEDMDCYHEWNSSDNEDLKDSEDDLSVPDSAEGESDPP